jgi:hypothetical protein
VSAAAWSSTAALATRDCTFNGMPCGGQATGARLTAHVLRVKPVNMRSAPDSEASAEATHKLRGCRFVAVDARARSRMNLANCKIAAVTALERQEPAPEVPTCPESCQPSLHRGLKVAPAVVVRQPPPPAGLRCRKKPLIRDGVVGTGSLSWMLLTARFPTNRRVCGIQVAGCHLYAT